MDREVKQAMEKAGTEGLANALVNSLTKSQVLDRILKDDSRGLRILPAPGYSHKMQTIRSNKVRA